MESTDNPNLFVLRWFPKNYTTGLHRIIVKAKVNSKFRLIDLIDFFVHNNCRQMTVEYISNDMHKSILFIPFFYVINI